MADYVLEHGVMCSQVCVGKCLCLRAYRGGLRAGLGLGAAEEGGGHGAAGDGAGDGGLQLALADRVADGQVVLLL